jgi:hypothetical protein
LRPGASCRDTAADPRAAGAVATECGLMLVLIALASCFGGGWVIAWNRCRRERFIDLGSLLCP